jgi:hypothetical protein
MSEIDLGIDYGEVNRGEDSDLIPPGLFLMTITRAKEMDAKEDKTPQLIVGLQVKDVADEKHHNFIGAKIPDFVPLTAKAAFRLTNLSDAATGTKLTGRKFNPDVLLGKEVVAKVKQEMWEGVLRSRVERYSHISKWRKSNGSSTTNTATPAGTSGDVDI